MTSHCGYIALIGRPNVGKSTLMNRILHQKISITSRKPQTTRHSITGICTEGDFQFVYVDTPGLHQNVKKAMNRMMNKTAIRVLNDVDVIVLVIDGKYWQAEEDYIVSLLQKSTTPCVLVINKIDTIADKLQLLPWIEQLSQKYDFAAIIPLSAKTGIQVASLHSQVRQFLPESPPLFPADHITDRSLRFLCAELLREKIFRRCGQELPYQATVEIESYEDGPQLVRICALIWVDKNSHKPMIIGEKGSKLKEMATEARMDMEVLIGKKVFLQCWCKVKPGWSQHENTLRQLGYDT